MIGDACVLRGNGRIPGEFPAQHGSDFRGAVRGAASRGWASKPMTRRAFWCRNQSRPARTETVQSTDSGEKGVVVGWEKGNERDPCGQSQQALLLTTQYSFMEGDRRSGAEATVHAVGRNYSIN
jgi:hypothetical protein